MATLTKAIAEYHTWATSEIADGDIIDCEASLGRPADQVTIESIGGQTTIQFNVLEKVYQRQDTLNSWVPYAGFYTQPYVVTTKTNTKDNIVIEAGATWLWENEGPVTSIKIVTKATNLKITIS